MVGGSFPRLSNDYQDSSRIPLWSETLVFNFDLSLILFFWLTYILGKVGFLLGWVGRGFRGEGH